MLHRRGFSDVHRRAQEKCTLYQLSFKFEFCGDSPVAAQYVFLRQNCFDGSIFRLIIQRVDGKEMLCVVDGRYTNESPVGTSISLAAIEKAERGSPLSEVISGWHKFPSI